MDQKPEKIDLRELAEAGEWRQAPIVDFDRVASLVIAQWVLLIFAGVYGSCFLLLAGSLFLADATFDKTAELLQFMVQSVIPLVTLAVGFYLGDRSRPDSPDQ